MRTTCGLATLTLAFIAAWLSGSATAGPLAPRASTLATSSSPTIEVYGANSPLGTAFAVTVSAPDGTQAQTVPVELVRSSDTVLNFARLSFAGTIQLTIRVPSVTAYSISPRRYGIATQIDAGAQTLRFTLSNDAASSYYRSAGGTIRLVVHDHYGRSAKLFVFADRLVSAPVPDGVGVFDATQDFGVSSASANNAAMINAALVTLSALHRSESAMLYFPAGIYPTGTIYLQNDVTLYLAGKASLIRPAGVATAGAFVHFDGVHDAHVRGPGIINANLWHSTGDEIVSMDGASFCSLEDVTMTGTGNWSILFNDCSDILGRNYKLINELTANSDGTDPNHSRRVTIDGVFEHTQDDAFAIKTTAGSTQVTDSVTVTNAVIWTEKSALKIGSEVTRGISHVRFADNQIVLADRALSAYGNGSGMSGGFIDGVDYTGNTVERIQDLTQGKLVEFQVQYLAYAAPYAPISNLNVTDTFCYSTSPNLSTISGVSGTPISNVHFERFWIDDAQVMVCADAGNIGGYFTTGPNASAITFTDVAMPLAVSPTSRTTLALAPISPNPVHGAATIAFDVAAESRVELTVLDVTGREVAVLAEGTYRPGRYRVAWPSGARGIGAGVYFVRLRDGAVSIARRVAVTP